MQLLVDLLKFLAGNILTILGLTQGVSKQVAHTAQETTPNLIQDNTHNTIEDLDNIVYGLFALHNQLTDIKTVVDTLSVSGVPVTLPVVPPSGYGPIPATDIADQVWNGSQAVLPSTPGDALLQVARSLNTTGDFDMPLYVGIFRVSRIDWPIPGFYLSSLGYPTFDPTDVLSTDTLLSLLTRQNPTWTVGYPWGPQTYVGLDASGVFQTHYTTLIDEAGFALMKAEILGTAVNGVPPIWPTLAGVTLGTPVAIDIGVTIAIPMDGVLIDLTSVPLRLSAYTFGSEISYKSVGGISFLTDNGQVEPYQTLGFTSGIFTPKTMGRASGMVLRSLFGVAGTITPWTRN